MIPHAMEVLLQTNMPLFNLARAVFRPERRVFFLFFKTNDVDVWR